jgi:hypothetical protein
MVSTTFLKRMKKEKQKKKPPLQRVIIAPQEGGQSSFCCWEGRRTANQKLEGFEGGSEPKLGRESS